MSAAAESAYQLIRCKIFEGEFAAGQRLKESELSAVCNVSRTPVREALRKLATDGLVEITPHSGAIVAEWNRADIRDLYAVRHQLEALAATWAAERRSEAQLSKMKDLAGANMRLVEQGDARHVERAVAQINNELHHLIIEAANSRALSAAVSQVTEAPLMLRTFRKYDQARMRRSAEDHVQLVSAIESRDGELAGNIMKVHILSGLRSLLDQDD